jgi:hypothetical protein
VSSSVRQPVAAKGDHHRSLTCLALEATLDALLAGEPLYVVVCHGAYANCRKSSRASMIFLGLSTTFCA